VIEPSERDIAPIPGSQAGPQSPAPACLAGYRSEKSRLRLLSHGAEVQLHDGLYAVRRIQTLCDKLRTATSSFRAMIIFCAAAGNHLRLPHLAERLRLMYLTVGIDLRWNSIIPKRQLY
jgi:hypothetical protein